MIYRFLLISFQVLAIWSLHAQTADTLSVDLTGRDPQYALPIALVATGTLVNFSGKESIRKAVRDTWEIPATSLDDYLQHSPIVLMYAIQSIVEPEDLGRMSRHMISTEVLTLGVVYTLKYITDEQRPNGGRYSFPSGHTAHAFAGATVMYHALRDEHPVIAYMGYLPAIATGAFRMIKDKHWSSDVLVGAGIGMAAAHLTYQLDIWGSRKKRNNQTAHLQLGTAANGVGLTMTF